MAENAFLVCSGNEQCPDNYACRAGRCRSLRDTDAEPPALISVTPTVLTGSTVRPLLLELEISEPLQEPPTLTLGSPLRRTFTVTPTGPTTFRAELNVDASDMAGAWPVLATMIDLAGNVAADIAAATAIMDYTAPSVTAASIAYTPASDSLLARVTALGYSATAQTQAEAQIVFAFDEPTEILGLSCGDLVLPVSSMVATSFAVSLSAAAELVSDTCALTVQVRDAAGNEVAHALDVLLAIDNVPPSDLAERHRRRWQHVAACARQPR